MMAQYLSKEKHEQQEARAQQQEYKAELVADFNNRPWKSGNKRRTTTFIVLGCIAVLAAIFGWLVLLPSPSQVAGGTLPVGTSAPNFVLPVAGGGGTGSSIDLHTLRGHPVVINFWSESCLPCLSEVPYLQQVYAQHEGPGKFALLGVDQADPEEDIAPFGTKYKLTYPLLFDKGGVVNAAYGVVPIPTTYFIDSNGIIRTVFVAQLTSHTMQQGLASVGIKI
ncbi:MAG: hypothetical protein NVS4B7_15280 [Ktedonobacteraceae bacterium]